MRHRVFIAVNLPESLKKRLKQYREKSGYGPVRWVKTASLHLTLVFIGYVTDEQMLEICRISREIAAEFEPFSLGFKKIISAPTGRTPRMIWLEGEANNALTKLKYDLEEALLAVNSGLRRFEKRLMRPHITLARIRASEALSAAVDEKFEAVVPVASIEVMESDLKNNGAEYVILESCPLKM